MVDTIGFNDRTWLDDTGKPHSDQLHVIERYRRPDAGRLEVQYTLEDPKFLTRPYTFTRTFVPANREIQERYFAPIRTTWSRSSYSCWPGIRLSGLAVNTSIRVLAT